MPSKTPDLLQENPGRRRNARSSFDRRLGGSAGLAVHPYTVTGRRFYRCHLSPTRPRTVECRSALCSPGSLGGTSPGICLPRRWEWARSATARSPAHARVYEAAVRYQIKIVVPIAAVANAVAIAVWLAVVGERRAVVGDVGNGVAIAVCLVGVGQRAVVAIVANASPSLSVWSR